MNEYNIAAYQPIKSQSSMAGSFGKILQIPNVPLCLHIQMLSINPPPSSWKEWMIQAFIE